MNKPKSISPTVLSCLGAVGVFITAGLAVRATPKALQKIQQDSADAHDGDPSAYTKLEAIRSAWIFYLPSVITGTATVICIFGANSLNKKSQASLASAYALLNESFGDYKLKLRELYGEETHNHIIDEIVKEKARDVYISAPGLCGSCSLDFDEHDPADVRLFYDVFSRRYFENSITQVIQAEYHLNRNWWLGAGVTINDFYEFLGIAPIEGGDDLSWFAEDGIGWIDFNHRKTVLEDGLEVYIIELVFDPRLATEYD